MKNKITVKNLYDKVNELENKVDDVQMVKFETLQTIKKDMWILIILSIVTLLFHVVYTFK